MVDAPNDNELAAVFTSDAYDRAAIILLESLLHHLVDRDVITTAGAVEIVDVALDVKRQMAEENPKGREPLDQSLAAFEALRRSLLADMKTNE